MPSWSELHKKSLEMRDENPHWLTDELTKRLAEISKLRGDTTVIYYASSFLQASSFPNFTNDTSINREDINGFMNAIYETKGKKLTLILHTPGGDPNAVESIVEYLHGKYSYIEVMVPCLAMSGGAMISLASDLIIMGKASQVGPIDPQIIFGNKIFSARAIQETFETAKSDITSDIQLAHLWAPTLQSMGPSLLLEAGKSLSYSGELVHKWLRKRMLKKNLKKVDKVVKYFNAAEIEGGQQIHVHGQRIGGEKLEELGLKVEWLEKKQNLQEATLTAYHLMTLIFEQSVSIKFISNHQGKIWSKARHPIAVPPGFPSG